MLKIISVCIFIFFQFNLSAQSFYVRSGKNSTNFIFRRSDGTYATDISKGAGNSYELGYALSTDRSAFSFDGGLTFNEYNAFVRTPANRVTWKTNYVGIQSSVLYSFVNTEYFSVGVKVGVNGSKIIYGIQEIDDVFFDIKNTNDFKSILLQYTAGIDGRYRITDEILISLAYNFVNSLNNSKNTDNKFFIKTNQISVGFIFVIRS